MRIAMFAGLMLLGGVLLAAEREVPGPDGLVGFSGQVQGTVLEGGKPNTFMFKVSKVIRVWKNNEASNPKRLEGMTVPVGPRWEKQDGRWRPVERHVRFIKTLKAGENLTLELKHAEREVFAILELSEEQRKRAGDGQVEREGRGQDAEIRELRQRIEQLEAENRELRKRR